MKKLVLLLLCSFYLPAQELGRGINLGNMFEAPSETAWGNPFKEEYIAKIAEQGFKHIRMPIRWDVAERTQLTAPYTVNPAFLARVKSVVDLAISKNMYVIINMHHHEEIFTNPAAVKPRFLSQWAQIASYFKGYDDHLLFEVLNEPHDALTPTLWNSYFAEALAEIRKTNPTRKVLMGTASYGGLSGVKDLVPPNDPNLILSVHYYDPFNFTHQGADWAGNKDKYIGTKWENLAWEREQVISDFAYAIKWSKEKNIPLHVGEFGAYEKADMESRARWTTYLARYFESQGLSWAYWEFSAGFGIYDPTTNTFKTPLVNALLKNPMPAAQVLPTKGLFDLNGVAGWNLNLNSGATATMSAEGAGIKVNRTNATGTGWHIQLARSGFALSYKKRYLVTMKISGDKTSNITAYVGRSSSPYSAYSSYYSLTLENAEKEYTFAFTMNEPFDSNARLVFDLGLNSGMIQINSIKVAEVIEDIPLGVEELSVWKVYPNPFREKLRIEAPGSYEIRISDLLGRINQVTKMENEIELETQSLKTGFYLLQSIDVKTGDIKSQVILREN
jgi:aryl-phospho-beta-D-glucosidase BglC (GH1 family)